MQLYRREDYLQKIRGFCHAEDLIKVISGVRGCGKTCLMETIAQELRESGIPEQNIICLDLDRRGFRSIRTADQLDALIAGRSTAEGLKYLFLDGVRNVTGFEEVLNGFRTEGEHSIFITGSDLSLLSGERATKLTGRYLEFELFPLSFSEYLGMKAFLGRPAAADLRAECDQYLRSGGFPGALQADDADRESHVRGIMTEILQKDIRRRVRIRNVTLFERVQQAVIQSSGTPLRLTDLLEDLRKDGCSIGRETLRRYVRILEDARIICRCGCLDIPSRRHVSGTEKYYLSDPGFRSATHTDTRIPYALYLENIIYLHARSHGYEVSTGRIGRLGCDFVFRKNRSFSYAQVCMTIMDSPDTEDREYAPLERIRDNYPKYVLTWNDPQQERNGIIHQNIPQFLKEDRLF